MILFPEDEAVCSLRKRDADPARFMMIRSVMILFVILIFQPDFHFVFAIAHCLADLPPVFLAFKIRAASLRSS